MTSKIISFVKSYFLYILLIIALSFISFKAYRLYKENLRLTSKIVVIDNQRGSASVTYSDQDFEELKNENKELYDSLKVYKNQIRTIVQFKYKKEFHTDTVYCDTTNNDAQINIYEYANNDNDSIKYNLRIGSQLEPNWYKLDVSIADRFTLVTKKVGDVNQTDILSQNGGQISDVTVFQKKEKKKFFDHFSIGPTIVGGYDVVNNRFGVTAGIGITYKIK